MNAQQKLTARIREAERLTKQVRELMFDAAGLVNEAGFDTECVCAVYTAFLLSFRLESSLGNVARRAETKGA